MKKTLQIVLMALFTGLTSIALAQSNGQVDLDQLAAAVGENPDATASLVEEAVRTSPDQIYEITERLLASYPELTEEIILGAIAGMEEPLSEKELEKFLHHADRYRPALAPDIVI